MSEYGTSVSDVAMDVLLRGCLASLLGALLAACSPLVYRDSTSSTIERITDPAELKPLAFLQSGGVSRSEVVARLGRPRSVFEDGRIVIYRFDGPSLSPQLRPAEWSGNLHLVLLYGKDETVERWSLLRMGRAK